MDGFNVVHLFLLLVALILVLKISFSFIFWIFSCVFADRLVDLMRSNRQRESLCDADSSRSNDPQVHDDDISTDLFEHNRLFGDE